MAEAKELSFGKQVFWRAWWAALKFFEDVRHDIVLGLIALALVGWRQYEAHGLPPSIVDWVVALLDFLAPFGIVWLVLFVWHVWLAPSALVYEALKDAAARALPPQTPVAVPKKEKPINWAIWKQRSVYNLKEFAAILAKVEPTDEREHPEKASFIRLLGEAGMAGKLRVARSHLANYTYTADIWPEYFDVQKSDAVAWAEANDFDVSHIK